MGAYYATGFKPVSLLADTRYVRAWPGGTGDIKCGGNYASTIKPQAEAAGLFVHLYLCAVDIRVCIWALLFLLFLRIYFYARL